MGTSTDAYLYFGFDFYDPNDGDEFDIDDWEEKYVERLGLKDESGFFNADGEFAYKPDTAEYKAAEKMWNQYYKRKSKRLRSLTVEVNCHCSNEAPIWFVAVKSSFRTASRGNPEVIDPKELAVSEQDIMELRDFCKIMGIKWQTPKWVLASYWG